MALIVFDGLDHYASIADGITRYGVWQWNSLGGCTLTSPGRAGVGKSLTGTTHASGTGFWSGTLSSPISKATFGFAFNFGGAGQAMEVLFQDALTGETQCFWTINAANNTISFTDATGTVRGTALNAIYGSGWMFIELQNTISTTDGTAALRVNGNPSPSFPDLTGLNTQATANASVSAFTAEYIGSLGGGPSYQFDDFYIADGTTGPGSYPNNSFLGDVRCNTLFAIGDNAVQFTPLSGANYQMIDEVSFDGDATYNFAQTAGYQDSFNFQSVDADVNQVVGLQVTVAICKEDAGARTVAPVIVIGDTTYVGTPVSVDVSYLYITSIWPINPHTDASWTAADVNALAAGYQLVT